MEVLTANASQANGKISITGTTDPAMLAVSFTVYDKTGTTQLVNRSTAVDNGSFSYEIEIEEGEYQICVADFNGGDCKTVTVTTSSEEAGGDSSASSPNTGYQTIAKNETESAEPATNASANMLFPILAISLITVAAIAIVIKRVVSRNKSKNQKDWTSVASMKPPRSRRRLGETRASTSFSLASQRGEPASLVLVQS